MFPEKSKLQKLLRNSQQTFSFEPEPASPHDIEKRIMKWLDEKGVYSLSPREKQYRYYQQNRINLFSRENVEEGNNVNIISLNIAKSSFLINRMGEKNQLCKIRFQVKQSE
jgi:hypothetical protein